jgi:hypothetical protein
VDAGNHVELLSSDQNVVQQSDQIGIRFGRINAPQNLNRSGKIELFVSGLGKPMFATDVGVQGKRLKNVKPRLRMIG